MDDDTQIFFGGAVKALDDKGKFGGYLVLFGTPEATDASRFRDYFCKETDFGLDTTERSRVLYAHALDPTLKNRTLAIGTLKAQDAGVWLEGQLGLRDDYEKAIWGMVKDGKLGFSSGTAQHLIRRQKQDNGSHKILSWPLGLDASLTPSPAEPRTQAIALKSLSFDGLKGEHLGPHAEHSATMSAVRSLHDNLTYAVADTLRDSKIDGPAKLKQVKAAHAEASDAVQRILAAMMPTPKGAATKGLPLEMLALGNRLRELDDLLD